MRWHSLLQAAPMRICMPTPPRWTRGLRMMHVARRQYVLPACRVLPCDSILLALDIRCADARAASCWLACLPGLPACLPACLPAWLLVAHRRKVGEWPPRRHGAAAEPAVPDDTWKQRVRRHAEWPQRTYILQQLVMSSTSSASSSTCSHTSRRTRSRRPRTSSGGQWEQAGSWWVLRQLQARQR